MTGSLDRWNCWNAGWSVPSSSAITQARKRLGRHVFSELFERCCGPVAGKAGPTAGMAALGTARGAFLRRWRLLGIDGFDIDLPDTKENAAEFGYVGSGESCSAFPKARVVALAECGTHAFVAAEVDAYSVGEKTLAQRLSPRLRADELLTADRGFYSWQAWDTATATGAALLWRAPTQLEIARVPRRHDHAASGHHEPEAPTLLTQPVNRVVERSSCRGDRGRVAAPDGVLVLPSREVGLGAHPLVAVRAVPQVPQMEALGVVGPRLVEHRVDRRPALRAGMRPPAGRVVTAPGAAGTPPTQDPRPSRRPVAVRCRRGCTACRARRASAVGWLDGDHRRRGPPTVHHGGARSPDPAPPAARRPRRRSG